MHVTPTQRKILQLVARGHTDPTMVCHLNGMSQHTIKSHVKRLMERTHATTRAQLVAMAYESGVLVPGESLTGVPHGKARSCNS